MNKLRRSLAFTGFFAFATYSNAARSDATKVAYDIEAPMDIFVDTVQTADGPIGVGQSLYTLHSYQVDSFQLRLSAFSQEIEIAERPFLDGRVDAQINLLSAKVANLADLQLQLTKTLSEFNFIKEESDAVTPNQIYGAQADIDRGANDYLIAKSAFDSAAKQKQDAQDKIALARQHIADMQTLLNSMMARLAIKSTTAGLFVSRVHAGDFVKKGHILGSVSQ